MADLIGIVIGIAIIVGVVLYLRGRKKDAPPAGGGTGDPGLPTDQPDDSFVSPDDN